MTRQPSLRQWVLALSFLTLSALPAAGQTPAGTDPDPDGLCACVTRKHEVLSQALDGGSRVVDIDGSLARSGWRVRIGKPWVYDPVRKACVGSYEHWRQVPGQDTAWRSEGLTERVFDLGEAAASCRELGIEPGRVTSPPTPPAPVGTPATGGRGISLTPEQWNAFNLQWSLMAIARELQANPDGFFVRGGGTPTTVNNRGVEGPLPGFLSDRIRQGFTVLDDRDWLQAALASLNSGVGADEFLSRLRGASVDLDRQFALFGETFIRYFIPNSSFSTPVGPLLASSEHGSIRGTINGGGDFVYIPAGDMWRVGALNPEGPRLRPVTWSPSVVAPDETAVRLELPSATVTGSSGPARVVVDLASNGAAAVLVVDGQVQVRETRTGQSRTVSRGDAALVWPGVGVSQPVRVGADRFSAASRPRIRGSIVLRPSEQWSGPLRLDGVLPIESRLLYEKPAGGAYALEIAINGRPLTDPPLNKTSPMRYADGRNYPYREPNSARWMLFYSHDYEANNRSAGGGYEVMTDRGEAYRFVWNVAQLLGGQSSAQVQFRNGSDPGGPSLELRLLPAEANDRSTSATPVTPPTPAQPGKPKGGLLGGLVDALKDVAKGVAKPPSTGAVTPPSTEPASVAYGQPSAQGQPHLAVYTVSTLLGHGDFNYPLVVQLQDGSGRPMYPAAPLTVTVTSNDPSVVTIYASDRRPTATLTLKPADRSGSGGMSWDSVSVIAANAWVAGSATITATAPGLPAASVTVTVVPTRTPDNRSTPAQTAAPGRVRLTVLPPITETDRQPLASVELLDAQDQPTGIDFGPGDWTLESSNPAVRAGYSSNFRVGQIGYPSAPGQTQLTITSKRRGVTGSSATLTAVAPGTAATTERAAPPPAAVAVAPPLPMPAAAPTGTSGRVAPRNDFGEPVATGRISNIVTAREVRNGAAVDITDTFPQDVNPIHVWFRIAGFAPGATLTSRWTYLGGAQPLVIGTGEFMIAPTNDYGTFSYELAEGRRWPAGEYRVEILREGAVAGSATFMVTR